MKGPADCANVRRKKVRMPASAQHEIQRLQVVHADRIGIDCSAFVASLMLMVRRSNAEIRQKPRHGMCDREALARRVAGRAGPAGVSPCFNRLPALGVPRLPSIKWLVRYYPDARMRGEREETEMKRFASSLVLASALAVTALSRRSSPSPSPFRFRENRCWRLRWGGLHRRFFRHPSRRVRPGHGSFDDKVRKAG